MSRPVKLPMWTRLSANSKMPKSSKNSAVRTFTVYGRSMIFVATREPVIVSEGAYPRSGWALTENSEREMISSCGRVGEDAEAGVAAVWACTPETRNAAETPQAKSIRRLLGLVMGRVVQVGQCNHYSGKAETDRRPAAVGYSEGFRLSLATEARCCFHP